MSSWNVEFNLRVAKQCPETVVHVLLDMAVKQREPRLVGDKVHYRPAVIRNHHRIFYDASRFAAVYVNQFEFMAMQVQRMGIARAVTKNKPVTSSLPEHEFPFVRILLSVHQ